MQLLLPFEQFYILSRLLAIEYINKNRKMYGFTSRIKRIDNLDGKDWWDKHGKQWEDKATTLKPKAVNYYLTHGIELAH